MQVDALCASLQDNNVLVQRSTLDLLLHVFPMHCCHLTQLDTVTVLTAAIGVVLRRDMSLNRRLYAWLIGTDANGVPISIVTSGVSSTAETGSLERQDSEPNMEYFDKHSKSFLVQAVKRCLSSDVTEGHQASLKLRPFKILMSLLDKPEIGSAILEDIFLDVLRCIYRACVTKTADQCARPKVVQSSSVKSDDSITAISEVVKTANLLLGSLEPSFIWQFIAETLESTCAHVDSRRQTSVSDRVSLLELCTIVDFMLDKLSVVCVILSLFQTFSLSISQYLATCILFLAVVEQFLLCIKLKPFTTFYWPVNYDYEFTTETQLAF